MKKNFIIACVFVASFSVAKQNIDDKKVYTKFDWIGSLNKKGSEFFKADYKNAMRSKIVQILSNFFYQQKGTNSTMNLAKEAIADIEAFRSDKQYRFDGYYCAALDALESFIENMYDNEVYKKYVELFDTNMEMADIADALTWMASSMSKLSRHKYSQETMSHIVNKKFLYRHIYILSRLEIFSHLNYSQRAFVLQMSKWFESAIGLINISNGPGHADDQADLFVGGLAIVSSDAKKFHNGMNEIFSNIENIKNGYVGGEKRDVGELLNILKDMKQSAYLNVINIGNGIRIKPTRSMIHEIVNTINAAENSLKSK